MRKRITGVGCAWLVACAPLDGPASAQRPDAAFVRACDDGGCACGGGGMRCCDGPPTCDGALRCIGGTCARPAPRCVTTGIFEPGFLIADFAQEPGVTACTDIPRELTDPTTPGTFDAPAPEVGALECEGLAPGEHTVRLVARVRALAQQHAPQACHCTGLVAFELRVTQAGGPQWQIGPRIADGIEDRQCRAGPDGAWSQRVTVGADGHLALRVDLTSCSNDGEPRCLFLRGASLTLDEGGMP